MFAIRLVVFVFSPVSVSRVDFIVVLESIVSLILKAVQSTNQLDVSALRALRVLRPLRAITYIQQVRSQLRCTVFGAMVGHAAYTFPFFESCRNLDPDWFCVTRKLTKTLGTAN